jgi:hypothetical protein
LPRVVAQEDDDPPFTLFWAKWMCDCVAGVEAAE